MTDKDFLSQFSGENNKPASFKEEERVKVTKEKKPVNVKLIVIILAIVLLVVGLVLFFMLRPTIEVKDFVGSNASEAKAWIKQNDIETQGIIFKEEYNFDYDEGYVISQSIEAGKKVRKNVKMDFVVSSGADPDELISVPDIENMYKDEIQAWIKDNKLTKTKVMSSYSSDVEDGAVISYEFKGVDADNFTRSSTLNISVSKGPQPAGTITVEDFTKQDYSVVEAWGKKNNIEIYKSERYDEKVAKDLVISQSVEPKKTIKEGETLTVVVSKGKAVYAKNFVGSDVSELDHWASKNGVYVVKEEIYNGYKAGTVISQSIAENNIVTDEIKVEVSLGNPVLPKALSGMAYSELKEWVNEVNEKGADITRQSSKKENSDDVPVGYVIDINGYTNVKEIECGSTIQATVSLGKNIWVKDTYDDDGDSYSWSTALADSSIGTEEYARKLCDLSGLTYEVVYKNSNDKPAHSVVSFTRNGTGLDVAGGYYVSESETIVVTISIGPEV